MSGCVLTIPNAGQVQAREARHGSVYLYESVDGVERPYLCIRAGNKTEFVCLSADSSWVVIPLGPAEWLRVVGPLRVEGDAL